MGGSNVGWMQPHSLIAKNGASGGTMGRWILTTYKRSSALLMHDLHFRCIEPTVVIQLDVVLDQPNRRDQRGEFVYPCPLLLEIHQRVIAVHVREGDGQNFTSRIVRNGGYSGSQSVPVLTQHTLDVLADGVEEIRTAGTTSREVEIQIAYKAIHRI